MFRLLLSTSTVITTRDKIVRQTQMTRATARPAISLTSVELCPFIGNKLELGV